VGVSVRLNDSDYFRGSTCLIYVRGERKEGGAPLG